MERLGCMEVHAESKLAVVPELDEAVLTRLIRDEAAIVVVKGYASAAACDRIVNFVRTASSPAPYTHDIHDKGEVAHLYFGVDRVGTPFNSTLVSEDVARAREHYYRDAIPGIRRLRAVTAPELSPINRLRLELDELWPVGAHIASFDGRSMFVGIVRIMQAASCAGSELYPHFDALPSTIERFDGQFSASIFRDDPAGWRRARSVGRGADGAGRSDARRLAGHTWAAAAGPAGNRRPDSFQRTQTACDPPLQHRRSHQHPDFHRPRAGSSAAALELGDAMYNPGHSRRHQHIWRSEAADATQLDARRGGGVVPRRRGGRRRRGGTLRPDQARDVLPDRGHPPLPRQRTDPVGRRRQNRAEQPGHEHDSGRREPVAHRLARVARGKPVRADRRRSVAARVRRRRARQSDVLQPSSDPRPQRGLAGGVSARACASCSMARATASPA